LSRYNLNMWYVYILLCKNDALYTGIAKDVERRFEDHLNKKVRYTSYNPPVKILYKKKYSSQSKALKREAEIKSWPKDKKWTLIKE